VVVVASCVMDGVEDGSVFVGKRFVGAYADVDDRTICDDLGKYVGRVKQFVWYESI
jgi:hypothetical protein